MNEKVLKRVKNYIAYAFCAAFVFVVLVLFFKVVDVKDFVVQVENKTYDLRQLVVSKYRKPSSDIVILSIDDASYEYVISRYGAWPAPRDFWANIAQGIEQVHPKAIVFDLLFVQNFKAFGNTDKMLADVIKSNDNIYVAMNFDNQTPEVREPIQLPPALKTEITGDRRFIEDVAKKYTNVRGIVPEILYGTDKIGFINMTRDKDGVARGLYPIFTYAGGESSYKDGSFVGDFYKHLDLLVGMELLGLKSSRVRAEGKNIILNNDIKIPMTDEGQCYLNWYKTNEKDEEFEAWDWASVWETDKAIKENNLEFLKNEFENKIVLVGATATSLNDIKTVPIRYQYPGVLTHATFINNILDNNFVKKTGAIFDIAVTTILVLITGIILFKCKRVHLAMFGVFLLVTFYSILTLFLMLRYNIWASLVLPVAASIATLTITYVLKYIITSRDYEHTYKLAVTDGLTDLFNHRYFQEQMKINIENSKRYSAPFSLIMIDIDFFKKFNDTFGHQSGDAVLRQVAKTIKKNIRTTDVPCRYGGEEMSVILTNTKKEEAALVAQKICEAVRHKEFELANGSWTHVTISLGVATMPENGSDVQQLIEYADKCLYIAKENGRNQVVFDADKKPENN